MRRQDSLLQRRSALGLAGGGPLACTVASAHVGTTAHRFAWHPTVNRSVLGPLLGPTPPHSVSGRVLRRGNGHPNAPQSPAAVPRQRQQHQQRSATQAPAPSPEVQELIKKLARANSAATVIREVQEWREAAPGGQQRYSLAVVGSAALRVLTRVLGAGAKPHRKQCEEVEAFVRSLVSELHGLRETLTLEHLSAVASSLVVLLPLLEAHGGEAAAEVQGALVTEAEAQEDGHEVQGEQPRSSCSPQQARELVAALPELVAGIVSRQELSAVLVPVCQAYGSMLQLLQLTHADVQRQQPDALTHDVKALHASLSRTVLCAPRLARQLGHVGMADLDAAVQVAVQYRFALPAGILSVPASFWEAVRKRVDELTWAAREGAAVAEGLPAEGPTAAGQASRGSEPLDARPLVAILEAMGRDLAAKQREAERAPGGADRKPKGPGGAEVWLVDTTTLLLRSHQADMQDKWRGLVAAVASAESQLSEAKGDLEAADSKRRALQEQLQLLQKQVGKRKKAKAGQQADEQQDEGEAAEKALAKAKDEYKYYEEFVHDADKLVKDRRRDLQQLGVACVRQQLDMDALLQLVRWVAEAGGVAAAGGTGVAVGAALEGVVLGRLRELHPVHLVQALSALSATHHTLSQRAFEAVIQALVPDLGELSHAQQLDMLTALLGPGEQASESKAGPFLAALTRAVASSGPGGLGAAPAELLLAVMSAAARWRVDLGQEWVREVEGVLVRKLFGEGKGRGETAAAGGAGGAGGGGPGAGVEQGAPAAVGGVGVLRWQLMSDVVLPAVQRGQSFSKPDLVVCGLEEWRGRAAKPFPGLDAGTAALLLGWAARGHGWPPSANLHRVVEALAEAALRLQLETSEEVAKMLLVASRAVEATVLAEQGGGPATAPDFLVSAANQLLAMKPTTNDLASAVTALYSKPRPNPDLALLKRMLDMAQPQMAGARPLSYAQLLAGCVAAGWRPDDRWLAEHHAAAAKALRAADADVLLQLLSSLSEPTLAAQAGSDPAYVAARQALLREVALGLLRKPAVTSLMAQPDVLVGAVRQVAVQGAWPDGQWVARVVELTQELLPSLSLTGLASAAEGLAELRAAPPVSFLDDLLILAGEYGTELYGAGQLGLLLGGVQALRRTLPSDNGGDGLLSPEAAAAWGRMHLAFLPQCLDVLPTYTPAQAVMVAGGVVAFQLAQPTEGTTGADAPWLAGLLDVLLQRRTPVAPPPPALLLDLLSLGSWVLPGGGTLGASSSPQEGRTWSLLRSYVQQSLSDLAAAATEDIPWSQLIRAALAVGVRPEPGVLQRYAASLAQALYDTVRLKAPSQEHLSGAVGTLEEAITSALMPALPWAPEGDGGALLVSVLGDQKLLRACSPGQLALLCTYATQSGLGAKAALMWKNVAACSAAFLPAATGETAAVAAAAADALAVWYTLEVAGCSVAAGGQGAHMRTWLGQQLQGLDAGSGTDTNDGGQRVAWAPTPLLALQVLWVAHRLDGLTLVPQGVWITLWGALDAFSTAEQLQLLLPYQLVQLVELRAAAVAAELPLLPAPGGHIHRVLDALMRQPTTPSLGARAAAASDMHLMRALACARALAYLPAEELGGSWGSLVSLSLSFFAGGWDATALGGRASGLSAADTAAWVSVVERRQGELGGPAIRLTLPQLQGIAKALASPAAGLVPSAKGLGGGAATAGLGLRETLTVTGTLLALSPPGPKALEVLTSLLKQVEDAGDTHLLAVSSTAQLTALASAIILAGGSQPLPRTAAVALVQLLSCEGVVQQLPSGKVLQLVGFSLAGRRQLGGEGLLPDALADALAGKLVDEEGVSPLRASVAVFGCGASPTVVNQAAAFMQQAEEFAPSSRSSRELLDDLGLLYSTGLCETETTLDALGPTQPPTVGGVGPGSQVCKELKDGDAVAVAAAAAAAYGPSQQEVGTPATGGIVPLSEYTLALLRGLAEAARRGDMELWQEENGKGAMAVLRTMEVLYRRFGRLHMQRREVLDCLHAFMDSMPVPGGDGGDQQMAGEAAGGLWSAPAVGGPVGQEGSPIWDILQSAFAIGCTEPSTRTGRVRLGDARDGTVAAATGLSYWQLLTAQHSDTGGKQHGGSPHGPFLLSPAKTYRLVLHLSKCALSYCSSISKTAPEPAAALSAALRKMGLPAEDIIAQYGVYGSQGAGLQPAAFLIGLALDCEGRRHELGLDEEAARELKAVVYEMQALWAVELIWARSENHTVVLTSSPSTDNTASGVRHLNLVIDALEPFVTPSAPLKDARYRLLYERFRLATPEHKYGLVAITCNSYPPLPEGVTHWDDLNLLLSPYKLDEASLLHDLRRPPEARHHPLVLPTHLRTPAGGSPTQAQEAYIRAIAPVFVALRRLLALVAADGGLLLLAKQELQAEVPWVSPAYGAYGSMAPPPGRWAVLLMLVVLPEGICRWLARREVSRGKVGSAEAAEARVEELAAEMLKRVPWAGHVWEGQQERLSEEERERLERELREDKAKLAAAGRWRSGKAHEAGRGRLQQNGEVPL